MGNIKEELINDLVATAMAIDELWPYHPDNVNREDVVAQYDILIKTHKNIEHKLKNLK